MISDNAIELVVENSSSTPFETYAKELQQVLINIIKNAVDALTEFRKEQRRITVTATEEDSRVLLKVYDNGGGVDEAIQNRIFEPYFSTKEEKNGTGLGLYMSKTIVERHLKGTITYERFDEGSCFTIAIPLQ